MGTKECQFDFYKTKILAKDGNQDSVYIETSRNVREILLLSDLLFMVGEPT